MGLPVVSRLEGEQLVSNSGFVENSEVLFRKGSVQVNRYSTAKSNCCGQHRDVEEGVGRIAMEE